MNILFTTVSLLTIIPDTWSIAVFFTNTTIAHPESGLFIDYVGPYTPSEVVIHNSAVFPMTVSTCHFLPLAAAEKIPSCNISTTRTKRALPLLIALGAGAINLGLSTYNHIKTLNLNKQIALVQSSLNKLSTVSELHRAQLIKIHGNQIQFAEQLDTTQKLLESTITVVNNHSYAFNALQNTMLSLETYIKHSFLYQALTQIFQNDLTLAFLAPQDLHAVVYSVIREGNLTFNSHFGSIPVANIITRLLIHQEINFMPSIHYSTSDSSEIGRLIITSFFSVPHPNQQSFLVYKLITIPFLHKNDTLQLTQIPTHIAVNPSNNVTIEWYDRENLSCDFRYMTTCRDTPPFRLLTNDTCLGQIFSGNTLSKCFTTSVPPGPFFLTHLRDNLWITSSTQSLHCVTVPRTEIPSLSFQTSSLNEQLVLPPVALVNVLPSTTIVCPGFSIPGRPADRLTSSIVILYNNTLTRNNVSVLNIHEHLKQSNSWSKVKFIGQEIENILQLAEQPQYTTNSYSHPMYISSFVMILIGCLLVISAITVVWYIRRCYSQHVLGNIRLTLPPPVTHPNSK